MTGEIYRMLIVMIHVERTIAWAARYSVPAPSRAALYRWYGKAAPYEW